MKKVVLFLILISLQLPAQDGFHDSFFSNMEKMIKEFQRESFETMNKILKDDVFKDFIKNIDSRNLFSDNVTFNWQKKGNKKILTIKGLNPDNKQFPLDIKIKDSTLSIKGTSISKIENKNQKSTSVMAYNKSMPLPNDIDPESASFKREKDNIIITFKLKTSK